MNRRLFLGLAAALLLCGCNGGGTPPTTTTTSGSAAGSGGSATFKVALLTPGEVSDAGWNALAYRGLEAIKAQVGAEIANKVSSGTQMKDDLRSYAQQGFNLVIGHGFEYNGQAIEVGPDFPKTIFVTSSGGKTLPNVGAFRFELEDGFYLAGMMAAKISKTGIVAEIGGEPGIPSIESTFKAFEAGARAARPDIKIKKLYGTTFADIASIQHAAETAIDQGADVLIHQANEGGEAVFKAAAAKHVWAIGANANQNDDSTGAVIASAVIIADPAFVDLAKQVKAGTYKGHVASYGMDKGAIDFVLNPNLKDKVPADVQKLIEDTKAKIKSGKLVTPKDKL